MIIVKLKTEAAKRSSFRSLADKLMKETLQKTFVPEIQELVHDMVCDEATHATYVNEIFITDDGNRIQVGSLCCHNFEAKVNAALAGVPHVILEDN